jgi:hypothetical protein
MMYNSWERFVEKNLNQNMSKDEATYRYKLAAACIAVALIMFGLFLGLFLPRWCMFTLFVPLIVAIPSIMQVALLSRLNYKLFLVFKFP